MAIDVFDEINDIHIPMCEDCVQKLELLNLSYNNKPNVPWCRFCSNSTTGTVNLFELIIANTQTLLERK